MGVPFLEAVRSANQKATDFIAEQAQRSGLPESVIQGIVRGPRGLPNTRTRLSHAYTLQTAKGQTIGAVFRSEVNQSRQIDREAEVEPNAVGEWADIVPQLMSEQSFTVARWDLYDKIFEEIFGTRELVMLTEQTYGFKLREVWRAPASFLNSRARQYEYLNCWFERLGREQATEGDRTVRVNAQLVWFRKRRVA